uniref:Chorismate synthase n=1 Tax=Aegilops tauschii subsp. strangulata TaxID=200361 RepID=A0A453IH81_AEGTS
MAAAPTSHQLAAGAPWSSLPRGGFRALTDSAPASVRFSVGRRRAARLEVKAAGNIFGDYFQVATYGESHGGGVGCVISGCPPRIPLTEEDMQGDLDRRRPGQSRITTPRKETDTCKILSGTYEGMTTGTPIHVLVPNTDQRGGDYTEMAKAYRPSHADLTYDLKYGVRSVQGGGRSSARETIGRVAAGAVAKKILKLKCGVEILAFVSKVHQVVLPEDAVDYEALTLDQIESNICRCPDPEYAQKMIDAIDKVRINGNSIGGVVTCIARNVPRGLGSPVFDKLEALLAKAMLSLPASKGFEIGSGFAGRKLVCTKLVVVGMPPTNRLTISNLFPGTDLTGSEHNDEFYMDEAGNVRTRTNRSGGVQGGISNGETIYFKVAFKPTATIGKKQNTVTRDHEDIELLTRGRHDPCVVPRAVPMVETMAALVLMDQLMAHVAQCEMFPLNLALQEPIGSTNSTPALAPDLA